MTDLSYAYTRTATSESILVYLQDGTVRTIASTNPRFADVRDYLFNTPDNEVDRTELLKLVDAGPETIKGIQKLSTRVSYHGGSLFFDGDPLDNAISNHIANMIKQNDERYDGFVLFLENLATNPSKRARQQLFTWVKQANLTITKDGRFLAYKGVRNVVDNRSISSGVEKVWVDGVEYVGSIPNPIGAVIEMARSEVNDDKDVACSKGLHAGTHGYAVGFGQKLLLVAINPRDVVSVPRDSSFQKLRVCRYEVLDLAHGQIEDTSYKGSHRWDGAPLTIDGFDEEEHEAEEDVTLCLQCGDETDGDQYCEDLSEGQSCTDCNNEVAYFGDLCDDCNARYDDEENDDPCL